MPGWAFKAVLVIFLLATTGAGGQFAFVHARMGGTSLITRDPSQVFLWLHPTATIRSTPDLMPGCGPFGGTPAGAGVITKMIPPFYVHGYGLKNTWCETSQDQETILYVHAGYIEAYTGNTPQQGLVTVQILKRNPATSQFDLIFLEQFPTLTQAGPVQVVGAVGEQLILQSTSGATFYFDVPARQFRPSLVATVTAVPPTGTPMPPSPLATPAP